MQQLNFQIQGKDYIELIKLLKAVHICESGGAAKVMVDSGMVKVNGENTTIKRKKLKSGDRVEVSGFLISLYY